MFLLQAMRAALLLFMIKYETWEAEKSPKTELKVIKPSRQKCIGVFHSNVYAVQIA